MPLIRGHHAFDDHFAQIPNDWLRDDRLSLEARGLLAQIMSHRPGWNLSIRSISAQNRIGKEKVRRIIDELMALEYLERSQKQGKDEKGRMTSYDYITRDPLPRTAEPRAGKPPTAIRPTKNTIPKENQLDRTQSDRSAFSPDELELHFREFWAAYPLKRGKGAAAKAYEKAIEKVAPDYLLDRTRKFRDDPYRPDDFTPLCTTWLNQERWDDEPYKKRDKDKTNSEKNVENLRSAMALLGNDMKEVESEQIRNESAIDFGVNFRSAQDI